MEVTGFLQDASTFAQDLSLTLDLIANRVCNSPKGVDVLRFGSGSQRRARSGAQRNVDVCSHISTLHTRLGNAESTEDITQSLDVSSSNLGGSLACTLDGARHDLDQGNARTVVVNQRVVCTLNSPVSATDVGVLTGVFFHVCALNLNAEHGSIFQLDVNITVIGNGLIGL